MSKIIKNEILRLKKFNFGPPISTPSFKIKTKISRFLLKWEVRRHGVLQKCYSGKFFQINAGRSSHWRCSVKKDVRKNFANFIGKHLCRSLFFNKVVFLFKKRLRRRCFPLNFTKFLKTSFCIEHLWWLLL